MLKAIMGKLLLAQQKMILQMVLYFPTMTSILIVSLLQFGMSVLHQLKKKAEQEIPDLYEK
jgi:hypothetical protein